MKSNAYLAHHGIKGQKWGVRRFQNSDGSYTEAGKQRYGRGEGRIVGTKELLDYYNNGPGWKEYKVKKPRVEQPSKVTKQRSISKGMAIIHAMMVSRQFKDFMDQSIRTHHQAMQQHQEAINQQAIMTQTDSMINQMNMMQWMF